MELSRNSWIDLYINDSLILNRQCKVIKWRKKGSSQQTGFEQPDKNETWSSPHTIRKNYFEIDQLQTLKKKKKLLKGHKKWLYDLRGKEFLGRTFQEKLAQKYW